MTPIRAVIADDEKELRTQLKTKLSRVWPELDICGEAENGLQALDMIEAYRPQIAFLDIRMPGLSGMDVAKKIAEFCRVVFVTAYDQYALEAFEAEAVDYLLKPITENRLKQTVDRLQKQMAQTQATPSHMPEIVERIIGALEMQKETDYLQWIRTPHKDGIRLIDVDKVYYFKASDKYTLVKTVQGESLIKKTIKELARELNPNQFWQIHRGTIVNVSCIAKVSRSLSGKSVIRLKDLPETLSVSRSYVHLFRHM